MTAKTYEAKPARSGLKASNLLSKSGKTLETLEVIRDLDQLCEGGVQSDNTYSMKNNEVELQNMQAQLEKSRANQYRLGKAA